MPRLSRTIQLAESYGAAYLLERSLSLNTRNADLLSLSLAGFIIINTVDSVRGLKKGDFESTGKLGIIKYLSLAGTWGIEESLLSHDKITAQSNPLPYLAVTMLATLSLGSKKSEKMVFNAEANDETSGKKSPGRKPTRTSESIIQELKQFSNDFAAENEGQRPSPKQLRNQYSALYLAANKLFKKTGGNFEDYGFEYKSKQGDLKPSREDVLEELKKFKLANPNATLHDLRNAPGNLYGRANQNNIFLDSFFPKEKRGPKATPYEEKVAYAKQKLEGFVKKYPGASRKDLEILGKDISYYLKNHDLEYLIYDYINKRADAVYTKHIPSDRQVRREKSKKDDEKKE